MIKFKNYIRLVILSLMTLKVFATDYYVNLEKLENKLLQPEDDQGYENFWDEVIVAVDGVNYEEFEREQEEKGNRVLFNDVRYGLEYPSEPYYEFKVLLDQFFSNYKESDPDEIMILTSYNGYFFVHVYFLFSLIKRFKEDIKKYEGIYDGFEKLIFFDKGSDKHLRLLLKLMRIYVENKGSKDDRLYVSTVREFFREMIAEKERLEALENPSVPNLSQRPQATNKEDKLKNVKEDDLPSSPEEDRPNAGAGISRDEAVLPTTPPKKESVTEINLSSPPEALHLKGSKRGWGFFSIFGSR
jgi:hypothetical protein